MIVIKKVEISHTPDNKSIYFSHSTSPKVEDVFEN